MNHLSPKEHSLKELLTSESLQRNPHLFQTLEGIFKETQYRPGLQVLVRCYQEQLADQGNGTEFLTEQWFTLAEIENLGLGYSRTHVRNILLQNKEKFSSRARQGKKTQEYLIQSANISLLTKDKATLEVWRAKRKEMERIRRKLEEIAQLLNTPRSKPQESSSTNDAQSGIWMTVEEIRKAGSPMNKNYLATKIGRKHELFHTRTRGQAFEALITPENYHAVGLSQIQKLSLSSSSPKREKTETLETLVIVPQESRKEGLKRRVRFEGQERAYTLYAAKEYSIEFFAEIMSAISKAFTPQNIHDLFTALSATKSTVSGRTILEILETAKNAFFLYEDSYKALAAQAGLNNDEIRDQLEEGEARTSVRYLRPGLLPHLPRDQLDHVMGDMRFSVYGTREWSPDIMMSEEKFPISTPVNPSTAQSLVAPQRESVSKESIASSSKTQRLQKEETMLYSLTEVSERLRKIHQSAFPDTVIQSLLRAQGWATEIPRGEFEAWIQPIEPGILLLSTTSAQKKLEAMIDSSFSEIKSFFEKPQGQPYLHRLPGEIPSEYLLKSELPQLKDVFDAYRGRNVAQPTGITPSSLSTPQPPKLPERKNDNADLIKFYEESLARRNLLPREHLYTEFINLGIFNHRSPETIRSSYTRFGEEMEGYCFFSVQAVKERTGLEWDEFRQRCLPLLEERGMIKDIVKVFGITHKKQFYVLKRGSNEEVCAILEEILAT